jgi:predicted transcriptional regulator
MNLDNAITVAEVSRMTGRTPKTIHRDIAAGRLSIIFRAPGKTGTVLVNLDDVINAYDVQDIDA